MRVQEKWFIPLTSLALAKICTSLCPVIENRRKFRGSISLNLYTQIREYRQKGDITTWVSWGLMSSKVDKKQKNLFEDMPNVVLASRVPKSVKNKYFVATNP